MFEVQTRMVSGWENCWTVYDKDVAHPWTFESREEAEAELNDYLQDIKEAVKAGYMQAEYPREDFRIVEVP